MKRFIATGPRGISGHGNGRGNEHGDGHGTALAARPRRRGGFTLIELLIVIGIILVLMSIGVLGFRSMEATASLKQAKINLAAGDAFIKGMNSIGAPYRLEGDASLIPKPLYYPGSNQVSSPGDVSIGTSGRINAINLTIRVMNVLLSNPDNKKAILALPTKSLLAPDPGLNPDPNRPPILADPWGNPMIWVPSGGLTGITTDGGGTNLTITSSGQASTTVIGIAQNHGFWASAGPDGNFTTGDDNLYSFQEK